MAVALLENGGYKPWLNIYANSITLQQVGGLFIGSNVAIASTQSGQTLFAPDFNANVTITLPLPSAGWNVKVVFTSLLTNAGIVLTFTNGTATLKGNTVVGSAAGPNNLVASNHGPSTNLIFTATNANGVNPGDYIEFCSDGNFIYFNVFSTGIANLWSFT
jgi:hypothetical protein